MYDEANRGSHVNQHAKETVSSRKITEPENYFKMQNVAKLNIPQDSFNDEKSCRMQNKY